MIFVSHTHVDKPVVEPFAIKLREVFGEDSVFYDSWSIQPGDGIIDRMNAGLSEASVVFFFVSKQSLQSKMVELEWQNALLAATKEEIRLVAVKLDDCLMPPVLLQSLYIDAFGQGPEVATRQLVDVANGKSVFEPAPEFHNIRAKVSIGSDGVTLVEFYAVAFMEPRSMFVVLVSNAEDEIEFTAVGEGMTRAGFNENVMLQDGRILNGILEGRDSATSPGFPFIVKLTPTSDVPIRIEGLLREVARDDWKPLPYTVENGLAN